MALRHSRILLPYLASKGHFRQFISLPESLGPFAKLPNFLNDSDEGMQRYHERKIMPYSRQQLFQLVADVDSYQHFIPFCTASKVLKASRSDWKMRPGALGDDPVTLEAELKVGFLGMDEAYTSQVVCKPLESVQATASSSTPLFRSLVTTWAFQPASPSSPHATSSYGPSQSSRSGSEAKSDDGGPTLLTFDIAFAFASPLHAAISKGFFGRVSSMMVNAFEQRCLEVYGRGDR